MNEDESFLARWSRRKREAAEETSPEPEPKPAAEAQAASADAVCTPEGDTPRTDAAAEAPTEAVFDPSSLPPVESIAADTDIRAYLARGVPEEVTRAALRRAWTSDPAIRDFIGIAENQWDFNAPDGVPGFGVLEMTEGMRRLIADTIGALPSLPSERVAPPDHPAAAAAPESLPQVAANARKLVADADQAHPGGNSTTPDCHDSVSAADAGLEDHSGAEETIVQSSKDNIASQGEPQSAAQPRRSRGRALPV